MKKLFLLLVGLTLTLSASAIRAKGTPFQVRQPDGTLLTLRLVGDEMFHYLSTPAGQPVLRGSDGAYYIATLPAGSTSLVASSTLATDTAAPIENVGIVQRMLAAQQARRDAFLKPRAERTLNWRAEGVTGAQLSGYQVMAAASEEAGDNLLTSKLQTYNSPDGIRRTPLKGSYRGLVILVNFSDLEMVTPNPQEAFTNMFNEKGYSVGQHVGSVSDYFLDQSYGQFDLEFDVVGPVTLSRPMAYYGGNDSDGYDKNPAQMIYDALSALGTSLDLSPYDWDGDGKVEQVFVIYAGYSEASYGPDDSVWPHEWTLTYGLGRTYKSNGYTVDTYACSSELKGNRGSTMDGIGAAVHEFSHCLGFPDFYDTNYVAFGMNQWSVMDSGTYNGDSDIPATYTSYERWFAGWLEPTELTEGTTVAGMKAITDEPECYVVYNDRTHNEYFLLENHQGAKWDKGAAAKGMLVLHVDYNESAWLNNIVNNTESRQRMTIIPADNKLTSSSLSGDTYPGSSRNSALTDTSTPAAALYNANTDGRKYMGKPIESIAQASDGTISFLFMGGESLEAPTGLQATAGEDGVYVEWDEVERAQSYTLEVTDQNSADVTELLVEEDFSGFTVTSDGAVDISSKLDSYMQTEGWTGSKLYASTQRLKLGSSKQAGNLVSPLFNTPLSGNITVKLDETTFGADTDCTLTVKILNAAGTVLASASEVVNGGSFTFSLPAPTQKFQVGFYPDKRAYFDHIEIYDGTPAAEAVPARVITRTTIEGIKEPHYLLTSLDPSTYALRVRAVTSATGSSDWSAPIYVKVEGAVDAISEVQTADADAQTPCYDLSGRRIAKPVKGVYILGGRKVVR